MRAITIALTELRRMTRDRVNLFFLFVFPVVLILLLGASFGGSAVPKVGVLVEDDGALARDLLRGLEEDESIVIETRSDRGPMLGDIERGALQAGVIIPEGYSAALSSGDEAAVTFVGKPGDFSAAVRETVDAAVAQQSAGVRAARVAAQETGGDFEAGYAAARRVAASFRGVAVEETIAGHEDEPQTEGRFDTGASTQLILFTFVNSLAGSVALVQTRQHGVLRRMLAAPISSRTILFGETLGRFLVALMQGVFIIVAAALLFGVSWGDMYGAAAVVTLFALVSTGAAMLAGSLLSNEQQAGALVPFGLALAALGGSMVPLEVFPDTMRAISRITPHSWANEAFDELIAHGARVPDILPQLSVLAAFAAVLLGAGSIALHRRLAT